MRTFHLFLLNLLILLLIGACTRNDAQREFEKEAYQSPVNFTRTNQQGQIIEADETDWRTSPLYQGLVSVNPPFPNPVNTSTAIQFEIDITGIRSVTGLEVMVRYTDGSFGSIFFINETLQPGLTTFQINPLELGDFPTPESVRGLHRVYLYDGNQQMISYGDIMVE